MPAEPSSDLAMPAERSADLGMGRTVGRSALAMAGGTTHRPAGDGTAQRPAGVATWSRFRYPQSLYKYAAVLGTLALIAFSLENHLTKQRILELYLNVVEWGDASTDFRGDRD